MALPPEEVGRRIRSARVRKGWTVEQLARAMGVNWRTVQRWQAGHEKKGGVWRPTLPRVTGEKSLLRLAEVLDVPPGYLVESTNGRPGDELVHTELRALRAQVEDLLQGELEGLRALVAEQSALIEKSTALLAEMRVALEAHLASDGPARTRAHPQR